jgi:hypothetical protein
LEDLPLGLLTGGISKGELVAIQEDTRPTLVPEAQIDLTEAAVPTQMQVRKRDGSLEPVNLDKIVKAITRSATNEDGTLLDGST